MTSSSSTSSTTHAPSGSGTGNSLNYYYIHAISSATDIAGVCLLFLPYVFVMIPYFRDRFILVLQSLYLHKSPRTEWNNAVNEFPPRRLAGYLCALIILLTPCVLLYLNHSTNSILMDTFQVFMYVSLPILLAIRRPLGYHPCDLSDVALILLIIVPIKISMQIHQFLPDVRLSIYGEWPSISMLDMTAFNIGLGIYFIFRPLKDIGFTYNITHYSSSYQWILFRFFAAFALFLVFGLSIGIPVNWIQLPHAIHNIFLDGVGKYFAFFFLICLPLEFLFRGIIQNLMHSYLNFRSDGRAYLFGGKTRTMIKNYHTLDESTRSESQSRNIIGVTTEDNLWPTTAVTATTGITTTANTDNHDSHSLLSQNDVAIVRGGHHPHTSPAPSMHSAAASNAPSNDTSVPLLFGINHNPDHDTMMDIENKPTQTKQTNKNGLRFRTSTSTSKSKNKTKNKTKNTVMSVNAIAMDSNPVIHHNTNFSGRPFLREEEEQQNNNNSNKMVVIDMNGDGNHNHNKHVHLLLPVSSADMKEDRERSASASVSFAHSTHSDGDDSVLSYASDASYLGLSRDFFQYRGFYCYWFLFDNVRDWVVLTFASLIYGLSVVNFGAKKSVSYEDKLIALFLSFWLAFCCGWLWRHTNSILISCILQASVIFLAAFVFNKPGSKLCNGACMYNIG